MSPKNRSAETSKDAPQSKIRVGSRRGVEVQYEMFYGADLARLNTIWQRALAVRRRFALNDLDTARLLKRFFDEPRGIGKRLQLNALGLINRHFNRPIGDERDPDLIDQEFRSVDSQRSPIGIPAFYNIMAADDEETLMSDLYTFSVPVWGSITEEQEREIADAVAQNEK